MAPRHLVRAQQRARRPARHADRPDEFARRRAPTGGSRGRSPRAAACARRLRDAARPRRPSAISAGIESPIGEPLATLPPSVPELRIGTEAKRSQASCSSGHSRSSAAKASASVAAAPISSASSSSAIRASASTAPTWTRSPSGRCCLVTHRPTSVAPATIRASGRAATIAASSSTVRGAKKRWPPCVVFEGFGPGQRGQRVGQRLVVAADAARAVGADARTAPAGRRRAARTSLRPRQESAGSRCSGRDCRTAPTPRRRAAAGARSCTARTGSSRSPACRSRIARRARAPCASWTGCSAPSASFRLSTVKTARPSTVGSSRMQALTGRQSRPPPAAGAATTTVQAPQSPSAQPSLVPVSRRRSRRNSSSVVCGAASATSTRSPFRRNRIGSDMATSRVRGEGNAADDDSTCAGAGTLAAMQQVAQLTRICNGNHPRGRTIIAGVFQSERVTPAPARRPGPRRAREVAAGDRAWSRPSLVTSGTPLRSADR